MSEARESGGVNSVLDALRSLFGAIVRREEMKGKIKKEIKKGKRRSE